MDSDNNNNIQHDHGEGYHQPIFLGEGVWVSGIQWAVPSPESYQNRSRIEMDIEMAMKIEFELLNGAWHYSTIA